MQEFFSSHFELFFTTAFGIVSGIFGMLLKYISNLVKKIGMIDGSVQANAQRIKDIEHTVEELKHQHQILMKMDSKIDVIVNDVSWLKKEVERK